MSSIKPNQTEILRSFFCFGICDKRSLECDTEMLVFTHVCIELSQYLSFELKTIIFKTRCILVINSTTWQLTALEIFVNKFCLFIVICICMILSRIVLAFLWINLTTWSANELHGFFQKQKLFSRLSNWPWCGTATEVILFYILMYNTNKQRNC